MMFKYLVGISAVSALRMEAGDAMGQLHGTYWLFHGQDIPDGGNPYYDPYSCVLKFHGNRATKTTYAHFHGDPVNSSQQYSWSQSMVEKIDFENRQLTLKDGDALIVLEQADQQGRRIVKM